MGAKTKAQIGLDDQIIHDNELEGALEERQQLKEDAAAYRKADKEVKIKVAALEDKMPFRCGRFFISSAMTQPKDVEFHTDGGNRISIKTADDPNS